MRILDEEGKVFGIVNVVDLIVLLLAIAIVIASVAVITDSEPDRMENNVTITVEIVERPYVVESLYECPDTEVAFKQEIETDSLTNAVAWVTTDLDSDRPEIGETIGYTVCNVQVSGDVVTIHE